MPNSAKVHEIPAFPKLLAAVRKAIGSDKLLSIAVPGKKIDMIAFTPENGPLIWPSVDYINIMSYDLMNRRDNTTAHHTSVAGATAAIDNYLAIGAPAAKINLGFAYYAKYFTTQGDCGPQPLDCPIVSAEDPVTGTDALTSGAWTFEKAHMTPVDTSNLPVSYDGTCGPEKMTKCATGCCSQYGNCGTTKEHCSGGCQHAFGTGCTDADVFSSWQSAAKNGVTDEKAGAQYYFDPAERLFWTWDTPQLISRKFQDIVRGYGLGGVMAWSLGEDSADWSHIKQMAKELASGGYTAPAQNSEQNEDNEDAQTQTETPAESNEPAEPSESHQADYDVVYVDGTKGGPEAEADEYDYGQYPAPADVDVPYAQNAPKEQTAATENVDGENDEWSGYYDGGYDDSGDWWKKE